jgi:glycosyltransferase involved in cell wall biosynthesis
MDNSVSVIMSVYNEEKEWIEKSIESILNQTWKKIEFFIIIDDPENRKAIEVISEYAARDTRIRYAVNDINRGLVYSLNRAAEMSQGQIIARMDADDISYPDRIEEEMRYLDQWDADLVIGNIDFLVNEKIQKGENTVFMSPDMTKDLMKYGNISFHPTWLMKRKTYDDNGGYRNIKACEDIDFLLRSLQMGKKVIRISEHVHQYRLREQGISAINGLAQYLKAEYLRSEYSKGHQIADIPETSIDQLGDNLSRRQITRFRSGNAEMNSFCENLRLKKTGKALITGITGFIGNRYYRQIFIRNMRYRIRYIRWVHNESKVWEK